MQLHPMVYIKLI